MNKSASCIILNGSLEINSRAGQLNLRSMILDNTMKYYEELLPEQTLYKNGWTLCISGTGYIQPSRQVVGLGSGNLWNRGRQCHLGTQGTTWHNIPCPYPQNSDCGDVDKVLPANRQDLKTSKPGQPVLVNLTPVSYSLLVVSLGLGNLLNRGRKTHLGHYLAKHSLPYFLRTPIVLKVIQSCQQTSRSLNQKMSKSFALTPSWMRKHL